MKWPRKIVDERQELEMRRVDSCGFWICFFGLVIAIPLQLFALELDFSHIAGEFIILIIAGSWAAAGHFRRGNWDYFSKPGLKPYIIYSLAGAAFFGIAPPLAQYIRGNISLTESLLFFAANFAGIFVLLLIILYILGIAVKRRQAKLVQEDEDEL